MSIFGWLNDQLLRMQWLSDLVTAGVAGVGLEPEALGLHLAGAEGAADLDGDRRLAQQASGEQ